MNTSADAPYLDCAYKLQEYDGRARRKRSEGKATWPGRKQVWRHRDAEGLLVRDVLALADHPEAGDALLAPVMRGGKRLAQGPGLAESRVNARWELSRLPEPLRSLEPAAPHPVEVAPALRALAAEIDARG